MTDNAHRFVSGSASHPRQYSELQARNFSYVPAEDVAGGHRRGRRGRRRRWVFFLVLIGLGWAVYDDPSRIGYWWSTAREHVGPIATRVLEQMRSPAQPTVASERDAPNQFTEASTSPVLSRSASRPIVAASGPAPGIADAEAGSDSGSGGPLKVIATVPPVRVVAKVPESGEHPLPKRDILQVRAESVGLHSALSPVLLSRLSKTDFRNAGYAIRTALAKTPDDKTFKWPRRSKAGMAIFEVRFVPGAAQGCRRYVVTIEKDRWLTTALPLEKCGQQIKQFGQRRES